MGAQEKPTYLGGQAWVKWVAVMVPIGIIVAVLLGWAIWSHRSRKRAEKNKKKQETARIRKLVELAKLKAAEACYEDVFMSAPAVPTYHVQPYALQQQQYGYAGSDGVNYAMQYAHV